MYTILSMTENERIIEEPQIHIPTDTMMRLLTDISISAGMPEPKAAMLSRILTEVDLRGVFTHGSRQICGYVRQIKEGDLNPAPKVDVVTETNSSLVVDGDGGLGYFPAYTGTLAAIEKAKQSGFAVLSTRNHGHIGAAGIYPRLTLAHDLLTFITSGAQLHLKAGDSLFSAAGGPPMCFSAPGGKEDAVVADIGATHYLKQRYRDHFSSAVPELVFQHLGLGEICQIWGGFLNGIPFSESDIRRKYPGANQGSLLITFQIALFMSPDRFKKQVDKYVEAIRKLQPLPGFSDCFPAGGIEAFREGEYSKNGIPLSERHRLSLENTASDLGVKVPW